VSIRRNIFRVPISERGRESSKTRGIPHCADSVRNNVFFLVAAVLKVQIRL